MHNCFSFLGTFSVYILILHPSFIFFRSDTATTVTNYDSLTITFVCIVASICLYLPLFVLEVNEYVHTKAMLQKKGFMLLVAASDPLEGPETLMHSFQLIIGRVQNVNEVVPIQFHVHVPIKGLGTYLFPAL